MHKNVMKALQLYFAISRKHLVLRLLQPTNQKSSRIGVFSAGHLSKSQCREQFQWFWQIKKKKKTAERLSLFLQHSLSWHLMKNESVPMGAEKQKVEVVRKVEKGRAVLQRESAGKKTTSVLGTILHRQVRARRLWVLQVHKRTENSVKMTVLYILEFKFGFLKFSISLL